MSIGIVVDRAARAKRDRLEARALDPAALLRTLGQSQERFSNLARRFSGVAQQTVTDHRARLESLDRLRETLSYKATLERGYAVVRADGEIATRKTAVSGASVIELEFADGKVTVGSGSSVPSSAPKRTAKPKPPEQGSLF